jgi:hypothetical protein
MRELLYSIKKVPMRDNLKLTTVIAVIMLFLSFAVAMAQETETAAEAPDSMSVDTTGSPPPEPVITGAADFPNDNGHALTLKFEVPSGDMSLISGFQVWRSDSPDGEYTLRGKLPNDVFEYLDRGGRDESDRDYFPNNKDFYYKVVAVGTEGVNTESKVGGPFRTTGQWLHVGKLPVLISVLLFGVFTVFFILRAKAGKKLYVRPIAGISAVDEAIGRATEMGKPILYILGLGTAADIATIASFTILSRVAKKVAEYQTKLIVPCYEAIVMTVAQEVVKSAYLEAGKPDQYDEDMVFFVTNSQFAYVAGVNGIMVREQPATNFYLGVFHAESLILAETGASTGAIQISGTDQVAQIPFFVVACDYTLIGEELYAASAYLGGEPILLGSLKAEDWAKGIFMVLLIVGAITSSIIGWDGILELLRVRL